MGQRKYPPLALRDVIAIVERLGFILVRKEGSHEQYERQADDKRPRSIVTVDTAESVFDDFLIKSMITQSNFTREEFYGATKRSARKAGVKLFFPG